MTENLWEIVDIYQRRLKQQSYYIIAFGATNILMLAVFFTLTNTIYKDITVPGYLLITVPEVFIGSLVVLYITYTERRSKAKIRVSIGLNEVLFEWKMQAIEETIIGIESTDPVPLEKIESYSHAILLEKINQEFPSLNLRKLQIIFPDTVQTIQKLLSAQPFLGTYYQVEQQFVKNFIGESKI